MARKITNREIIGAVAQGLTFQANSTRGEWTKRASSTGHLPSEWRALLQEHEHAGLVEFVVYSYATPIAWRLTDGTAVLPRVRYSQTTSRAQTYVRAGLRSIPVVEEVPAS